MGCAAVLGTGLIGASIGLGLRRAVPAAAVIGYDLDAGAAALALERGAFTDVASTPEAAVEAADVVVIATPLDLVPEVCERIAEHTPPSAAVTDVGSVKRVAVTAGERRLGGRFVGGHPMAGSERSGPAAAAADLFEGAAWALTPTEATSPAAYALVAGLVQALGARPVALDPEAHDALVARLSHVPQLVASALVEAVVTTEEREALLSLAGGGFRDVTRIAASDPELWVGIIRANRSAVIEGLASLDRGLDALRSLVTRGRWEELRGFLERTRGARVGLFQPPGRDGPPVVLALLVPDRPGVLAEVTTAAGRLGANIDDLRIVHSTEGGAGRLELVVSGEAAADALSAALRRLGYSPWKGQVDGSPWG